MITATEEKSFVVQLTAEDVTQILREYVREEYGIKCDAVEYRGKQEGDYYDFDSALLRHVETRDLKPMPKVLPYRAHETGGEDL